MDKRDIREDVFTDGVWEHTGMRLTHMPTGETVCFAVRDLNGPKTRAVLREFLIQKLEEKVREQTRISEVGGS